MPNVTSEDVKIGLWRISQISSKSDTLAKYWNAEIFAFELSTKFFYWNRFAKKNKNKVLASDSGMGFVKFFDICSDICKQK